MHFILSAVILLLSLHAAHPLSLAYVQQSTCFCKSFDTASAVGTQHFDLVDADSVICLLCRASKSAKSIWTHRSRTFTPCSSCTCPSHFFICCSSNLVCCRPATHPTDYPSCSNPCHSCNWQRPCTLSVHTHWSHPCCWRCQVAVVSSLHNCRSVTVWNMPWHSAQLLCPSLVLLQHTVC